MFLFDSSIISLNFFSIKSLTEKNGIISQIFIIVLHFSIVKFLLFFIEFIIKSLSITVSIRKTKSASVILLKSLSKIFFIFK
jgi:hypothetical protein